MASGRDRQHERKPGHQEQSPPIPPQQPGDLAGDMLRDVVAQTSETLAAPEHVDPHLRQAMVEVARRFAGQPMTVDPAGTALLEAVLRIQMPALAQREALLSRTARTVAASLLADPTARLRVEHLWARLAEELA